VYDNKSSSKSSSKNSSSEHNNRNRIAKHSTPLVALRNCARRLSRIYHNSNHYQMP
jgi:hypothetical protein